MTKRGPTTGAGLLTPSGSNATPILRRAVLALAVALVATAATAVVPLLGPLLIALAVGVILVNIPVTRPHVAATAPRVDKLLLRTGIVLLGLRISLHDIAALGAGGIAVVVITVLATFAATIALGRFLEVDEDLTVLIGSGFSICGAAAIAAVASSRRSRSEDVALAVALVTVFGTVMIVLLPALGDALGLRPEETAMWAGASIHEVAQVVVASSLISASTSVLALATAVKLGRVVLLAPVQILAVRVHQRGTAPQGPAVQPFVVLFLLAVTVRTSGILPADVLDVAWTLTTLLLAAAMFGLGTGIVARQLFPIPLRLIALATGSTVVAGAVPLLLITTVA